MVKYVLHWPKLTEQWNVKKKRISQDCIQCCYKRLQTRTIAPQMDTDISDNNSLQRTCGSMHFIMSNSK